MFEAIKNMFKASAQQAPRVHIAEPRQQTVSIKQNTGGALRGGMWVMVGDRVGILRDMNEFAVCSVMLTDSDGFNVVELSVPAGEVRQCKQSEIPAARVAHLQPGDLAGRGYMP